MTEVDTEADIEADSGGTEADSAVTEAGLAVTEAGLVVTEAGLVVTEGHPATGDTGTEGEAGGDSGMSS